MFKTTNKKENKNTNKTTKISNGNWESSTIKLPQTKKKKTVTENKGKKKKIINSIS